MQYKFKINFYNTKANAFQEYIILVNIGVHQKTLYKTIDPWNAVYNIAVAKEKKHYEEPPSCKSIFSNKITLEIQRRVESIAFCEDPQQYLLIGNIKKGKWID